MIKKIVLLFIVLILVSCGDENKVAKEISAIEVDFIVERFDIAFASADSTDLTKLKAAYPFMFSNRYDDTFWLQKIKDTIQQELAYETQEVFKDFKTPKEEIIKLFQHLKYYNSNFEIPRVITTTSSVDYRNKVIVTDTIALISIDTYLGSDHKFYEGIQKYIRENFTKDQIVVDLANAYAEKLIFQENNTLLDEMIYFGKQLYYKDGVIPFKTDAEKIGYSQEQIDWAIANEAQIWSYFIERELLFSTDPKLTNRFIASAPFSKFQLAEIDNESPGSIGKYIGWQIVKSFMDKNNVPLSKMLNTSAEDIFNKANFKPRK